MSEEDSKLLDAVRDFMYVWINNPHETIYFGPYKIDITEVPMDDVLKEYFKEKRNNVES
jgi:hypothetical protein